MAKMLEVSRSGFYAWLNRKPSNRDIENRQLLTDIRTVYDDSNRVYGSRMQAC